MQSGLNIIYAMLEWLDQKDYMCKQDLYKMGTANEWLFK